MAKETAKKNWKRNEVRMNTFTLITVAVNVLYIAVILYHNGGLPSFWDLLAIIFWGGQEYFALSLLKNFARPRFNQDGDLLDCPDVANPSELGYLTLAQDTLWVCWVVQTFCNIHTAFVVFYLPVPATFIYKGWTTIGKPLLASRGIGGAGGQAADGGAPPKSRQERRREELNARKGRK